jgi:hypothetical protein
MAHPLPPGHRPGVGTTSQRTRRIIPNRIPLINDFPLWATVDDYVNDLIASTDPSVHGVRRFHEMLATEHRVSATTLQTVGSKGYDGFTLALVTGGNPDDHQRHL